MAFNSSDKDAERDQWIVSLRPNREAMNPWQPHAFLVEEEPDESGGTARVLTVFLTNRECPWRCLMCDLWRHTLTETVPIGAIPAQIDFALEWLLSNETDTRVLPPEATRSQPPAAARASTPLGVGNEEAWIEINQIKLYNSGSFFDRRAIPPADYGPIAERVCPYERVILECHPSLVNETCARFQDLLVQKASRIFAASPIRPRLEVAMGLETVHPDVLPRLNKRMTLELFSRAAEFLRRSDIALRVFILVKPPFLNEPEGIEWARRSLDFAFDCGATVASLIPTRAGNGAIEALAQRGEFSPPKLASLEASLACGIGLNRGRVLADLWDLQRFSECAFCFRARAERLRQMNLHQTILPEIRCENCGVPHERGL